MSFVRTKIIKGREYKYLVSGVREGDKVRQKVVKYLGPVDPKYRIGRKREKSNASIYARVLSTLEREMLEKAARSNTVFSRDRAKIILYSAQRLFSSQIAKKMSCDERKVRSAIKAFNQKGEQSLQRGKAPGATPKFTLTTKKIILLHFAKQPKEFGLHFTTWTLPRLQQHLVDYKVVDSISIEWLRHILDEAGARLKRSKRWQYSPDKEFDKKNLQ